MVTLALGGWSHRGAAAVAADGHLRAAVQADAVASLRHVGLAALADPRPLVDAVLRAADVGWGDVGRLVLVGDSRAVTGVDQSPEFLHAWPARLDLTGPTIEILEADDCTWNFARRQGVASILYAGVADAWFADAQGRHPVEGYGGFVAGTEAMARTLGIGSHAPWRALRRLAERADAPGRWATTLRPIARLIDGRLVLDRHAFDDALSAAVATAPARLDDPDSVHVGAQARRTELAAAWVRRVSELLQERAGEATAWGGDVGTALVTTAPTPPLLPCPDARGAVLGAVLGAAPTVGIEPVGLTAVGELFDEAAVKMALESARLDYLYEPRPDRWGDRVSALLQSGKLVGWLRGRTDFGDVPSGARVVLADAAHAYCRENVNVYLRRRSADATLPVALRVADAARMFGDRAPAPGAQARLRVPALHAESFAGAVDRRGFVDLVVVGDQPDDFGLGRLLQHHADRTGHPGLVMVPLARHDGAVASAPRDGLAVTYSTPIDALVMGRFVLLKDPWLLRLPTT